MFNLSSGFFLMLCVGGYAGTAVLLVPLVEPVVVRIWFGCQWLLIEKSVVEGFLIMTVG